MRKVILTLLAATLVLSLAAGAATARRGLRAGTTHFFVRFNPLEFSTNLGTVTRCPVILDVTLRETIAKTQGALAGSTRVCVLEELCEGGRVGLLSSSLVFMAGLQTTYHIEYVSFSGELPNIAAVTLRIVGVRFWIEVLGGFCLANETIRGITRGMPVTGVTPESQAIPLGPLFRTMSCLATSGSFSGTGNLVTNLLGEIGTSVTLSLI